MALTLMKGSEAIAEAAIRAGARYFFGYPITPQSGDSRSTCPLRMPEARQGCFLQAESEIAAINMVYGAAGTGMRAMTSSSCPGVCPEAGGHLLHAPARCCPAVIVNVHARRPRPGQHPAQLRATISRPPSGGGNGDYRTAGPAPPPPSRSWWTSCRMAFDIADKYRIPVLVLADGIIGQMMEPVELPRDGRPQGRCPKRSRGPAPAGSTGDDPTQRGIINSLYIDPETTATSTTTSCMAMYKQVIGQRSRSAGRPV